MPYQTLIASVLHKSVTGRLAELPDRAAKATQHAAKAAQHIHQLIAMVGERMEAKRFGED